MVSNIEYDNFPKFLVSLGVVLIALPFIITLFFLQENSVLLVTEENVSELTEIARDIILAKQQISFAIAHNIIFIFLFCIVPGVILLYIGCKKWNTQQKRIDEMQRVECEKAIYEWNSKSLSEKQEEVEREINEKGYVHTEFSEEQIRLKQEEMIKEKAELHKQIIKKYEEVQGDIIEAITHNLMGKYVIRKNIRIGDSYRDYDAIAESQTDEQDYIFEIKYLRSAYSWNANAWKVLPNEIRMLVENYELRTNRKAKPVLLIAIAENKEEQVEKLKKYAQRYWVDEKDIILNVFTEAQIGALTESDIIGAGLLSSA